MKVFELAKKNGYDSKEVMNRLREAGIPVKTPVSVIPEDKLALAESLVPPSVIPVGRVKEVILPDPPKHVDAPIFEKLKQRTFEGVTAEGFEPRFNQFVMGIRRQFKDGKKSFSVLTYAFDPDTLETKMLKEEVKRTEAEAIMELKAGMIKRKVV